MQPLPTFEIIEVGNAVAPLWIATCVVGTVEKHASSYKKIDAKHQVADLVMKAIKELPPIQESSNEQAKASPKKKTPERESRYNKYFNYPEVLVQKFGKYEPVPLADRHDYFTKFHESLKNAAFHVMVKKYDDVKQQAYDVLAALQLKFTEEERPSTTSEPMVIIDVDCELDVVFMGTKNTVYKKVLEYFSEMLD